MMTTLADIQRRVGANPDGVWGPATAAAILAKLPPEAARHLANPEAFFKGVRALTGSLDTTQVAVINDLLASASHWSTAWLAYGLATAWHEARLRPIEEIGKGKGHPYGVPGKHGGQVPYGRGLVQLTHDRNYEAADAKLGLGGALIADYSKALDPAIAGRILISGMEGGWFSGVSLSRYLPDERGTLAQFTAARPIINVHDRDALIAGYAMQFQDALMAGVWA